MKPTIDLIDTIVSRLFDIEPGVIYSRSRHERIVSARFISISLRQNAGADINSLAQMYSLNIETIRHAIKKTRDLIAHNKPFRHKYDEAFRLFTSGCVPFSADLIIEDRRVRSRPNSEGYQTCGIVRKVSDSSFVVESFYDSNYIITANLLTGRISDTFESSCDIVEIEI